MSDSNIVPEDKDDKAFEVSLRVLGNELIGLRISVQNFTQKWIWFSMLGIVLVMISLYLFGSDISNLYKALK
jgi:hypothetical protein